MAATEAPATFICVPDNVELQPAPIVPEWIIEGTPVARNAVIVESPDKASFTMAWDCTAGTFNWHYTKEETVHVVQGSVVVSIDGGPHQQLRAGDVAFFPAGAHAVWHVQSYVRKVAFLRTPLPRAAAPLMWAYGKACTARQRLTDALRSWRPRRKTIGTDAAIAG